MWKITTGHCKNVDRIQIINHSLMFLFFISNSLGRKWGSRLLDLAGEGGGRKLKKKLDDAKCYLIFTNNLGLILGFLRNVLNKTLIFLG